MGQPRSLSLGIVVLIASVASAIGLYLAWDSRNQTPTPPSSEDGQAALPVERPFPAFELVDQEGQPFSSQLLLGRVWLGVVASDQADEMASAQLGLLAETLTEFPDEDFADDIHVVIFARTGQLDSDSELKQLIQNAPAENDRWHLLTGDIEQLDAIREIGFGMSAGTEASAAEVVLVDPQGDVREVYDPEQPEQADRVSKDIETVLAERVLVDDALNPTKDLLFPKWLQQRQESQQAAVAQTDVYHGFRFTDRLAESGITFRNRAVDDSARSWKPAHYDHGNGIAVSDIDGDGRLDIYFVTQVGGNALWRNLGGGRFEDITQKAGVALADRIGVTASFADIDNDGDADLYVTTVRGGNALFLNDGTGKFEDVSEASGLDYEGHSSAAVFFDFNRDGNLDVLLVNVGQYTSTETAAIHADRFTPAEMGQYRYHLAYPDAFAAHLDRNRSEKSLLFENQGGHTFTDVTEKVGLDAAGWSGDASPIDANADGWPDLYVLNMQGHDEYYENVEGRKFVKRGRELFPQTPWGSMGIKVFDFNNDGRQDIFLSDMHTDMSELLSPFEEKQKTDPETFAIELMGTDGKHIWGNALYRNDGNEQFAEVSDAMRAENYWPWGLSSGDLNADGFEDVVLTSCMNFPFRYAINSVLLNDAGQQFVDAEFVVGIEPRRHGRTAIPWFELDAAGADSEHRITKKMRELGNESPRFVVWGALGSRASALFDLEGDGDLDIVTNDFNSEPMVLVSNLSKAKDALSFIKIRLQGTRSNRDGLGAVVTVVAGDNSYVKVYDGQSGYLSQSRMPLYFGLGSAESIERIEVQWPSGTAQTVPGTDLEMNSTLDIVEPKAE